MNYNSAIGRCTMNTTFGKMNIPLWLVDNFDSGSTCSVAIAQYDTFYSDYFASWISTDGTPANAHPQDTNGGFDGTFCNIIGEHDNHVILGDVDIGNNRIVLSSGDNITITVTLVKGSYYYFGFPVMVTDSTRQRFRLVFLQTNNYYFNESSTGCAVGVYGKMSISARRNTTLSLSFMSTEAQALDIVKNSKLGLIDPYEEIIDESEPGKGDGDGDTTSTPVPIPSLPTINVVDTKFISLYTPTLAQLQNLASYMWSTDFDLTTFRKLFADPMDCIIGLTVVPFDVPHATGTRTITVGNIPTTVAAYPVNAQYVSVDCGSLTVSPFTGSYLDYEPYTKIDIYLPYIGTQSLNADDIMNKTINVVYHIDVLTGACIAFIKSGDSVLYSFIGQCAANIPITSVNFGNIITGLLDITRSLTHVASGGNALAGITGVASASVNIFKPNIEKSGTLSGVGGFLGIQKPYLVITKPSPVIPGSQNEFIGYPSYINRKISDVSGYTEFEKIIYENMSCTKNELTEIDGLLKEGVIL